MLESGSISPAYAYARLFAELRSLIDSNDDVDLAVCMDLIKSVSDGGSIDPAHKRVLERKLTEIFPLACLRLGFVDAYGELLWDPEKIDIRAVVYYYFDQIEHGSEQDIAAYKISETADDILDRMELPENTKLHYVYRLYSSLEKNCVIGKVAHDRLLRTLLDRFCTLDDDKTGDMRVRIILNIARTDIFENDDRAERENIFWLLLTALHDKNRLRKRPRYVSVLAQLFRALYFYSTLEVETLETDFRTQLGTLFQYQKKRKNNETLTLARLVLEESANIIQWLADDIESFSDDWLALFEYFPGPYCAKTAVWTQDHVLQFTFAFYLLEGYPFHIFPIRKLIEDNGKDVISRRNICYYLVSYFDDNGELLDSVRKQVTDLAQRLGARTAMIESYAESNFTYFNTKLQELNLLCSEAPAIPAVVDLDKRNEALRERLAKFEAFHYCSTIPLDGAQKIALAPEMCHIDRNSVEDVSDEVALIRHLLNSMIAETLPAFRVKFDLDGVKTLLGYVKGEDFKSKNYQFYDDLAIKQDVRATPEYEELRNLLQNIPAIKGNELGPYVFLKLEQIQFNASITSCKITEPTDQQCEEQIAEGKVADGKYRLDGAIYDHAQALRYVKQKYFVKSVELCVATNIDEGSGYQIKFRS